MDCGPVHIRATIFDVYGTLLEVSPAPADAAARWERLWHEHWGVSPRLSLHQFGAACDAVIGREHAAARARGIAWPEVCWPAVVLEVLPELAKLEREAREEFVFQQACLWHTVRMSAAVAEALQALRDRGCLLGLASNAQAYTVRELAEALATHGLGLDLFESELCFWSFEHGFSKPDPHVFQILTTRLAARGIGAEEVLMVGDRLETDIEPARAAGWQTWHLDGTAQTSWAALVDRLRGQRSPSH